MPEYVPFSLTEEVSRRQNYAEQQIASGAPLVAIKYKDGVLLLTKTANMRRKISPVSETVAFGGVGTYFHLKHIRRWLRNATKRPGISKAPRKAEELIEMDDGLTDIIGAAYSRFDVMPYEVDIVLAENNGGTRLYRVDYMGNPYQRDNFIVCGGSDRSSDPKNKRIIEERIQLAAPDFATMSLNDAAKVSVEALNLGINPVESEILHAGILDPTFRYATEREAQRFLQFTKR